MAAAVIEEDHAASAGELHNTQHQSQHLNLKDSSTVQPGLNSQWSDAYRRAIDSLRGPVSFFVWEGFIKPLVPVAASSQSCTVAAPSAFHRDWVRDHYAQTITEALKAQWGCLVELKITLQENPTVSADIQPTETEHSPQAETAESNREIKGPIIGLGQAVNRFREHVSVDNRGLTSSPLNPDYTFDRFVAGACNRVSLAACQEAGEKPGDHYSPLVLVGGSGVGKTHLLHAVGHAIKQKQPHLNIVAMQAEQWVNHYIYAVRQKRFDEFRNFFRNRCDVLLLDDVGFLEGKTASQNEFFHTFNTLYELRKQIVLTMDRYPHQIQGMQERLQSRLGWGLVSDLRVPDLSTRMAVVQTKALQKDLQLPDEVANYIAQRVSSSVRALEGALNRVAAFARMARVRLTLENARECLEPFVRTRNEPLSMQHICSCVAAYYGLRDEDLQGACRRKHVATARQVAMWLCHTRLHATLVQIGRFFGNRSHTTALASVRKIESRRDCDVSLQSVLLRMEQLLSE